MNEEINRKSALNVESTLKDVITSWKQQTAAHQQMTVLFYNYYRFCLTSIPTVVQLPRLKTSLAMQSYTFRFDQSYMLWGRKPLAANITFY